MAISCILKQSKIGDNGASERERAYLNAIGILDTTTWQWTIPTVAGIPPSRRSYAAGGLLNDKYLTVAFGKYRIIHVIYIYIFNL